MTTLKPKMRPPVGRQVPTPARVGKTPAVAGSAPATLGADLPLPHERDQSAGATAVAPDPEIAQAKRDIDAGLVDTDMRATPGLDSKRRAKLVTGPGGKPPALDG